MHTHLKELQYYEDLFDKLTVESGRRHQESYDNFTKEFYDKLTSKDQERPGHIFAMNVAYMQLVGDHLLHDYDRRESTIHEWMSRDRGYDDQIVNARLMAEPKCRHCSKPGLRITDKSLMHRGDYIKYNNPQEVLFVLRCSFCDKNTVVWEDGSKWERRHTYCPKCRNTMEEKSTSTKKVITTIYTCPKCKYAYKDVLRLDREKESAPDPNLEEDKRYYCLQDEELLTRLQKMQHDLEAFADFGRKIQEREDNKHIYEVMKEVKKPKIAELAAIISPAIENAGYIEFTLEKPEISKDVFVGFSCLDSKSDRSDYDSRKTLEKTIKKALDDTNWRLMSNGIHYRLGYLSGRVRAYEREEDIRELVIKSRKLNEDQTKRRKKANSLETIKSFKGPNGETIIL